MKVIGLLTVALGAIGLALGVAVGVSSIPDIKRYLRIRAM